jgi:hypothetical protein
MIQNRSSNTHPKVLRCLIEGFLPLQFSRGFTFHISLVKILSRRKFEKRKSSPQKQVGIPFALRKHLAISI